MPPLSVLPLTPKLPPPCFFFTQEASLHPACKNRSLRLLDTQAPTCLRHASPYHGRRFELGRNVAAETAPRERFMLHDHVHGAKLAGPSLPEEPHFQRPRLCYDRVLRHRKCPKPVAPTSNNSSVTLRMRWQGSICCDSSLFLLRACVCVCVLVLWPPFKTNTTRSSSLRCSR